MLTYAKVLKSREEMIVPLPIAFADDTDLAWHRLSITRQQAREIRPEEIPEFESFCKRIVEEDGADCLMLWLGSLLDPKSNKSQYVYLCGPGGDGKSVLTSALQSVLKDKCARFKARDLTSAHFGGELEGSRLAIIADENCANFVSGGVFKEITGEDYFSINEKFKAPRIIQLFAKILITSNSPAEIRDSQADIRRIISISLTSPNIEDTRADPTWGDRFIASAELILGYCWAFYEEILAENPHYISRLPAPKSSTENAILKSFEEFHDGLQEIISVTGDSRDFIPRAKLLKLYSDSEFGTTIHGARDREKFYSAVSLIKNKEGFKPELVKRKGTYGFKGIIEK